MRYVLNGTAGFGILSEVIRIRGARASIPDLIEDAFELDSLRSRFHGIEHHLARLSSAFHV
jgi:hypothetical protein